MTKKTWRKKPLLGKRQTSKRKLEPVFKDAETEKTVQNTKVRRKPRGENLNGVRLKTNRRGKKSKFINHAV